MGSTMSALWDRIACRNTSKRSAMSACWDRIVDRNISILMLGRSDYAQTGPLKAFGMRNKESSYIPFLYICDAAFPKRRFRVTNPKRGIRLEILRSRLPPLNAFVDVVMFVVDLDDPRSEEEICAKMARGFLPCMLAENEFQQSYLLVWCMRSDVVSDKYDVRRLTSRLSLDQTCPARKWHVHAAFVSNFQSIAQTASVASSRSDFEWSAKPMQGFS